MTIFYDHVKGIWQVDFFAAQIFEKTEDIGETSLAKKGISIKLLISQLPKALQS